MPATSHAETERKYDVDSATVLPSLAGRDGVASVGQAVTLELEAVYFDTEDLALARHGITLRRRTGGVDDGWHLKLPSDQDTRTEVRMPLGRARRTVPGQLLGPVRAIVRDHPLVPVARLRNHRLAYDLLDSQSVPVAQVCDDTVTGESLLGGPTQHWREWEVELAEGSALSLESVEPALLAVGARRSTLDSKLSRVLADAVPAGPPKPTSRKRLAHGSAADVLAARLAEQVAALHEHDAGVRADRPASVHRLRIAARRLRSALTTYRPLFDQGSPEPVRADLRWLGQNLASARDAEVLRERLEGQVAAQPAELVMGPVARRLGSELGRDLREGRERALAVLDSERYFRLLDALDALIEAPPLSATARRPAATVLPGLLHRDAKRLRRAVKAARRMAEGEAHEVALHEVRKKAKRLRYAAESAVPVLGGPAKALAKGAKRVQQALGVHHDTVVARRHLREAAARAYLSGENAFTFGRLHALEEQLAADAERDFAAAWKDLPLRRLKM